MVKIRMTRMGRTHRPFYRINAVDSRTQRDGKVIENLGWYNPMEQDASKNLSLKGDRIKHWLSVGAQASDTVNDILAKEGLIDAAAWKAKRHARVAPKMKRMEEEAKAKAAAEAAAMAKAAAEAAAKAKAEAEKAAADAAEKAKAEAESADAS